jgi:uncharacterized Zn-binding protein involved in type VI secretion
MPSIARRGDPISNGDKCSHGSNNVRANNLPVIRKSDLTAGAGDQNPSMFMSASGTVRVNNIPVIRVGDADIPSPDPGNVSSGSPNVRAG